jgi:hypothetical protein
MLRKSRSFCVRAGKIRMKTQKPLAWNILIVFVKYEMLFILNIYLKSLSSSHWVAKRIISSINSRLSFHFLNIHLKKSTVNELSQTFRTPKTENVNDIHLKLHVYINKYPCWGQVKRGWVEKREFAREFCQLQCVGQTLMRVISSHWRWSFCVGRTRKL